MTDLVSFRIEIPAERLATAASVKTFRRAERFVQEAIAGDPAAEIEWFRGLYQQTTVIGKAPRSVVNVLMAIVQGGDLAAVLDMYEEPK